MSAGRVHVVGGGLAGLAAAVRLAAAGRRVRLDEAAPQAGGRCRSYFDAELGCRIDNGNHLLLAGNRRALDYLERIGALDTIEGPPEAAFPFIDAATGERWTVRPNRGAAPWWIASAGRRAAGTTMGDHLAALALRRADPSATVAAALGGRPRLYRRLWEPLAVAALNTRAEEASAELFWRLLKETLGRGGRACRPLAPRQGLSESFVDPALAYLRAQGGEVRCGTRLRALEFAGGEVCRLAYDTGPAALGPGDGVVLAVPAAAAARLVPALTVPDAYAPIVNAHYRIDPPPGAPLFIGVVGGTAQWVFRKRGVLSVTVSAAHDIVDRPSEALRDLLWRDAALAYRLPAAPTPPARIVKERRATFLASPEQLRRRPGPATRWTNLFLAGDYTDTGLPATIEGAIGSGFAAAERLLARSAPAAARRPRRPAAGEQAAQRAPS